MKNFRSNLHVVVLVVTSTSFSPASAFECQATVRTATTNYGQGISEVAHEGLTPFQLGPYNAVIAFDGDHCKQMCCEESTCYVAVFDQAEAVCYLKGAAATDGSAYSSQEGFVTYDLLDRTGYEEPLELEPTECNSKKGVAFSFDSAEDLDALAPGTSWWYNWSPGIIPSEIEAAVASSGSEYIPMIWGEKDMTRLDNLEALGQCSHLLGFNEPNFEAQAGLTPEEAANLWSTVKIEADELGAGIVSPAVNFCGSNCNEQDPHQWLDEFFAICGGIDGGCGVTTIATHVYTCEVKYLNKILHGYLKYELPVWVTEFACGDDASLMNDSYQAFYLSEAMKLLELHPSVERYAWFTGRGSDDTGVIGADLLGGTGELTEVGEIYVNTFQHLQKCAEVEAATLGEVTEPTISSGGSDVDPDATEITNVVIGNVGGTGTYSDVVSMAPGENMQCTVTAAACVQEEVSVSGPLAPFDEDVTVAFRGPMNIHNIVWYEGEADSLSQTSRWTPTSSDNLVFMTNQGGSSGCAGEWTVCGGSSQTYADETGSSCASEPTQFDGKLDGDTGVNIMSGTECMNEAACGFYRGVGMEGWKGGSDGTKVMVFEVDMPDCGSDGFSSCEWNRPAVWALNSKVVRTAQYGCNCRGMGSNGGCGEFDIVEAVIGNDYSDMMFTTVYDFKGTGSPGQDKFFLRPSTPTHYAAIFRGGADAYLQVVQLADFDYGVTSMSGTFLDSIKSDSSENHDIYEV